MNLSGKGSGRQPVRLAWSLEHLENEQANFRSSYLDKSTLATYKSGLNSYLAFCELSCSTSEGFRVREGAVGYLGGVSI